MIKKLIQAQVHESLHAKLTARVDLKRRDNPGWTMSDEVRALINKGMEAETREEVEAKKGAALKALQGMKERG